MNWEKVVVIAVSIAVLVVLTFYYYPHPSKNGGGRAKVIVSLYFGSETILEREVRSGLSAVDALKSVANVSTSYGGGFVSGINGINGDAGRKIAWFYYINGMLANVGADRYVLRDGDVMRWDYHPWGDGKPVSGELMDFPEPLLHGYASKRFDTTIVYDDAHRDAAYNLYDSLRNITGIHVGISQNISDETKMHDNLIVIGSNTSIGEEVNSLHDELGFRYFMQGGYVVDSQGKRYLGAFAEMAQSPFNPNGTWACENVVIYIAGDGHDVETIINSLLSGHVDGFWLTEGLQNEN